MTPCFNAPIVELLTPRELAAHPELSTLGPDVMDSGFDPAPARARLRARTASPIGVALIDQRVLAGVGKSR